MDSDPDRWESLEGVMGMEYRRILTLFFLVTLLATGSIDNLSIQAQDKTSPDKTGKGTPEKGIGEKTPAEKGTPDGEAPKEQITVKPTEVKPSQEKAPPEKPATDKPAPLERKDIDVLIYRNLKGVIDQGADLYNGGDWAGCHRLYEGALLMIKPMLEHRPQLQAAIENAVNEANQTTRVSDRAFVLRTVIDRTRKETAASLPRKDPAVPMARADATLWERLGGEKGVTRMVTAFLDKASIESKLRPIIRKNLAQAIDQEPPELKARIVEFVSAASGGTLDFKVKNLKEAFKPFAITPGEYDLMVKVLRDMLTAQKVKPGDIDLLIGIADSARKDIVTTPAGAGTPATTPPQALLGNPPASLWTILGGEKGVAQIIDDFINPAIKDPAVNYFHDPKFKPSTEAVVLLKKKIRDLLAEATGGPLPNQPASDPRPVVIHPELTQGEFAALVSHLKAALVKNNVKLEDQVSLFSNLLTPSGDPSDKLIKKSTVSSELSEKGGD